MLLIRTVVVLPGSGSVIDVRMRQVACAIPLRASHSVTVERDTARSSGNVQSSGEYFYVPPTRPQHGPNMAPTAHG